MEIQQAGVVVLPEADPNEMRAIVIPRHMADYLFSFLNGGYLKPDAAKARYHNNLVTMLANCEYDAAALIPVELRVGVHEVGTWSDARNGESAPS